MIVSVLAALALEAHAPPAEACGVKLTIKPSSPRKQMARTSSPAHILLVGKHTRRLERELSSAGHDVEVASSPAAAKRKNYNVVVADASQEAEARERYGDAVVVSQGDPASDVRSVEARVARKPTRAEQDRPVVAAEDTRRPIAAGPPRDDRTPVAVKEPTPVRTETPPPPPPPDPKPADTTPPPDTRVATTTTKPAETVKPADDPTPAPNPKPKATRLGKGGGEIYFSISTSSLSSRAEASLAKTVKWMQDNPDVQVTVEGHADPSGSASLNMTLSEARANSVRDHLVAQGIDSSRIEVIGYGDTKLKYSGTDSRNRRVAIVPKK